MIILYLLLTIFVLGIMVLIHEFGHFITARACGVQIDEFSIGMGPKLVQFKGKKYDTVYSIRALPVGGYVSMLGENGDSENENAFCKKKIWQRFIILFAGAFLNIVLGFLCMFIVVASAKNLASTTVAEFVENAQSPLYGLQTGDTITKVDGIPVHTGDELVYEIVNGGYKPVDLTVKRKNAEGKTETIVLEDVSFPKSTEEGVTLGNNDFKLFPAEKTVGNVLKFTFFRSVSTIKMVFDSLGGMLSGRFGFNAVSGPVGITETVGTAAKIGFSTFLYIVSVITINLGVFNLLPLPALDGGRIFFILIELLRGGKPVSQQFESTVHAVGMIILFGLMILITAKDIFKLL